VIANLLQFGEIEIDGERYAYDVVIDAGRGADWVNATSQVAPEIMVSVSGGGEVGSLLNWVTRCGDAWRRS